MSSAADWAETEEDGEERRLHRPMRGFLQLAPLFRAAVISQAVGDAALRGGTTNMNAIPYWSTGSQRHTLHGLGLTGTRTRISRIIPVNYPKAYQCSLRILNKLR